MRDILSHPGIGLLVAAGIIILGALIDALNKWSERRAGMYGTGMNHGAFVLIGGGFLIAIIYILVFLFHGAQWLFSRV